MPDDLRPDAGFPRTKAQTHTRMYLECMTRKGRPFLYTRPDNAFQRLAHFALFPVHGEEFLRFSSCCFYWQEWWSFPSTIEWERLAGWFQSTTIFGETTGCRFGGTGLYDTLPARKLKIEARELYRSRFSSWRGAPYIRKVALVHWPQGNKARSRHEH